MSLIVVGTGTGIGKTVTSCLIARRYRVAYWKPVATGLESASDTDTVRQLAGDGLPTWPSRYSFGPPLSPHLAARRAGRVVELQALTQAWEARRSQPAVIEGIGGAMVPLNDQGQLFVDWMQTLALPCVVVAATTLGTINHTLLTLEALRHRAIDVMGVILNGPADSDNAAAIARFGQVEIIDHILWQTPLTARSVAAAAERFDPRGMLQTCFAHA